MNFIHSYKVVMWKWICSIVGLRALPIINTHLCALPIINTCLRAFTLINTCLTRLCLVLCRVDNCFVCVLRVTIHPRLSLLSFILSYKTVLHVCLFFFYSFILNHWLHSYLNNYFTTTFSDFLFCFSLEINLTNIHFSIHLTHRQIL